MSYHGEGEHGEEALCLVGEAARVMSHHGEGEHGEGERSFSSLVRLNVGRESGGGKPTCPARSRRAVTLTAAATCRSHDAQYMFASCFMPQQKTVLPSYDLCASSTKECASENLGSLWIAGFSKRRNRKNKGLKCHALQILQDFKT